MKKVVITVAKTPKGYSAACELLEGWIVAVTGSFEDLKLQVKESIDFMYHVPKKKGMIILLSSMGIMNWNINLILKVYFAAMKKSLQDRL